MRRVNGNPAIGRFNVNGSKETTRTHSDGIIDSFVLIRATGNMNVDRVIKRAAYVCNGSRLGSIFISNTTDRIDAKRFLRDCLDAM